MKKTIKNIILTSLILTTFSLNLFAQEAQDSYSENEITETEDLNLADDYEVSDEYAEINETTNNTPKKKPLIAFGNKDRFILTDQMSVFLPKGFSGVSQKGGTFTYNPSEKTAGFGCPYLLGYYVVQFEKEDAAYFEQAFNSYLNDFDNKKLERKNKKSLKKYGQSKVKLWWGSYRNSTPNNTKTTCVYGYTFFENSPYFCITIKPGTNKYFLDMNQDLDFAEPESTEIKFYFNKSQVKAILEHISSDFVTNLFNEYELSLTGGELLDSDAY